ncbi:LuxR C-terminal-related transcriptional regulator [Micromonospora sp. M12]
MRAYGRSILDEQGVAVAARDGHARHFGTLMRTIEGRFYGSEQRQWLRIAGLEHDNVLAALAHLEQAGDVEAYASLLVACQRPWLIRVNSGTGCTGSTTPRPRWPSTTPSGRCAFAPGCMRPRATCRPLGATMTAPRTGTGGRWRSTSSSATPSRVPGRRHGWAGPWCTRVTARPANPAHRRPVDTRVVGRHRRVRRSGNRARRGAARRRRVDRGRHASRSGAADPPAERRDPGPGTDAADQRPARRAGGRRNRRAGGDTESIQLLDSIGDRSALADAVEAFALSVQDGAGHPQQVTRLLATADAMHRRADVTLPESRRRRLDEVIAALRRQLGAMVFAGAWAEGVRSRPEVLVAEALAVGESRSAGVRAEAALLTPRQLQVALSVAEGLTNRQIANQLCIAEWTVVNHVRQVMRKLGCTSRVQVAWAVGRRR